MTLEQAIEHAEEVSNKCQNFVTAHKEDRELEFVQRTEKCAAEHRQLAAYLRELQERRKADSCDGCVREFGKMYLLVCASCKRRYADLYETERRSE